MSKDLQPGDLYLRHPEVYLITEVNELHIPDTERNEIWTGYEVKFLCLTFMVIRKAYSHTPTLWQGFDHYRNGVLL